MTAESSPEKQVRSQPEDLTAPTQLDRPLPDLVPESAPSPVRRGTGGALTGSVVALAVAVLVVALAVAGLAFGWLTLDDGGFFTVLALGVAVVIALAWVVRRPAGGRPGSRRPGPVIPGALVQQDGPGGRGVDGGRRRGILGRWRRRAVTEGGHRRSRRALTARLVRRAVSGGPTRRALRGGWNPRALTGGWTWRRRELTAAPDHPEAAAEQSAEERTAELYQRAVEQLDSDRAMERLGGMLALERLAQDTPERRPGVVDVLCAYLRVPYTPPQDRPSVDPDGESWTTTADRDGAPTSVRRDRWAEERSVRLTAQRILLAHLSRAPDVDAHPGAVVGEPAGAFWPGIRLDLSGATLLDFTIDQGQLVWAGFDGATFRGPARFDGVTFVRDVGFGGATFCDAVGFDDATFAGGAWFGGATFDGDVSLGGTTFAGTAWFDGASFRRNAWFDGATFRGAAAFDGVTFGADAGFGGATFHGRAGFDRASFAGTVWFGGAHLHGNAWFDGVTFHGDARFGGAVFHGKATFLGAAHPGRLPGLSGARVTKHDRGHVWPPGFAVRPDPDGAPGGTVTRRALPVADVDGEYPPSG